jgi:hypothetical protein
VEKPYTFYKCTDPSCLGDVCEPGTKGPLCGVCEDGLGKVGTVCQDCPELWIGVVYLIFVVLLASAFVANMTRAGQSEITPEKPLTKILMSYLQVLGLMQDLNLRFPGLLATSMGFAGGSSSFAIRGWSFECFISRNFYASFYWHLSIPLVAWSVVALAWAIARGVAKVKRFDEQRLRRLNSWGVVGLIAITLLLHPQITKECLQVFDCIQLGDTSYLTVQLDTVCGTKQHTVARTIAVFVLIFFVAGFPLGSVAFLYTKRRSLLEPTMAKRYQILKGGFRSDRYFWESCVMLRKILIVSLIVFLKSERIGQVVGIVLVVFVALLAQIFADPYIGRLSRRMEMLQLLACFLTLIADLTFTEVCVLFFKSFLFFIFIYLSHTLLFILFYLIFKFFF